MPSSVGESLDDSEGEASWDYSACDGDRSPDLESIAQWEVGVELQALLPSRGFADDAGIKITTRVEKELLPSPWFRGLARF